MTIVDQGVALPWLVVPTHSFVADPGLADVVEKSYERVTCANPTKDPDRMTIHVPSDTTVVSLGAASTRWNTDLGITGYANHHVHFETKVNDKTIVSLGEGATTSGIEGHDAKVPKKSKGYAMVTKQFAWHESEGQHYVLSQAGDISLRTMGAGKRAVVQAWDGFVDLSGGKEVTISGASVAIGAASAFEREDVHYNKPWKGKSPDFTFIKNAKGGTDVVSALIATHDIFLKLGKTILKAVDGKLKRNEYFWADVVKWGFDVGKYVVSAGKLIDFFNHKSSPPGSVKLSAEKDVVGLAGHDVNLFGLRGASLGSIISTSVGAGLMATLKAAAFAGVGGTLTSLKAKKKIEVISPTGDVVIGARKRVGMTSDYKLMLGGEELAQVSANENVLLGGKKRAWIGSAAGGGFGMRFDDKGVSFGKAKNADKLLGAAAEASPAIRIDDGKIEIAGTAAAMTLSDDLCLIEGPAVHFDAKQKSVTFNGSSAVVMK